jgi:hypothetical protein
VHGRHRVVDVLARERVARGALHPEQGDDVPALAVSMSFISAECMRTKARHLDPPAPAGVVDDELTVGEGALVDAHVRELAVLPVLQLERQTHEGLLGIPLEDHLLFLVVLVERDVPDLARVRQVEVDRIEQKLASSRFVRIGVDKSVPGLMLCPLSEEQKILPIGTPTPSSTNSMNGSTSARSEAA